MDEGRVTKAPIFHTASNIVYDDTKVFVGARSVPVETLFWSLKVLLKTKLLKKYLQTQLLQTMKKTLVKDKNVVYMASAPGFVPSGRKPQTVVNVKLNLPQAFPSEAVVSAYLSPAMDTSEERFSWAVPNLVGVRDFAMNRFGWDKSQVDKLLKPVIRALEERGGSRQARLEKYFKSHRVKLPDKGLIFTSNQEVFKSPCCKQSQTLVRISGFELSAHVRPATTPPPAVCRSHQVRN